MKNRGHLFGLHCNAVRFINIKFLCNKTALFFKKMMKIFKNIKASDMPDFKNICKDKNFKEIFHNYKIKIIENALSDDE